MTPNPLCSSIACVLFVASLSSLAAEEQPLKFSVTGGKASSVAVRGWSPVELEMLRAAGEAKTLPEGLLRVYVASEQNAREDKAIPLFGGTALVDDAVVFRPRYPFLKGLAYRAAVRRGALSKSDAEKAKPVEHVFFFPEPLSKPTTELRVVYPSGEVLPENQLKFYLHFSAPMSRGNIYRHLHLLKEDGEEVDLPFLELGEELWDSSGQRLTVLFDPGRIKRGLKPREEVGPVLEEGKSYTFVVDREWLDAQGQPLVRPFRKSFKSAAPDDVQPDVKRWKVEAPVAETRRPLTVALGEPLDHAMLHRVLSVRDSEGEFLAGEVAVDRGETRWRFTPESAWKAGAYAVVVATTLEDRAGNSLGRPFEVDIFNKVDKTIDTPTVAIPFNVGSVR
ncbi:MAG: hypothetical protein RIC55_05545 [Pirellulaceae bacterium]